MGAQFPLQHYHFGCNAAEYWWISIVKNSEMNRAICYFDADSTWCWNVARYCLLFLKRTSTSMRSQESGNSQIHPILDFSKGIFNCINSCLISRCSLAILHTRRWFGGYRLATSKDVIVIDSVTHWSLFHSCQFPLIFNYPAFPRSQPSLKMFTSHLPWRFYAKVDV